jgi:hypothetical protein
VELLAERRAAGPAKPRGRAAGSARPKRSPARASGSRRT